ncbi:MAG: M56 family metallopeptidase [Phormidesmis sp.]
MMHLHMVGLALSCAIAIRLVGYLTLNRANQISSDQTCSNQISLNQTGPNHHRSRWQIRWHSALIAFVVPPMLLIATAVAIVSMGTSTGYHPVEGQLSYGLSVLFMGSSIFAWLRLGWAAVKAQREVSRIPYQAINAKDASEAQIRLAEGRVIAVPTVFSAQVGLWSSELVVSQGLIDYLDDAHLAAVLAHESGHAHYRDTFWFFWLGGLRRVTAWLPYSEVLWQELLLLREIRADRWAARSVDPLVLAESLMSVITAPLMSAEAVCPGFSCAAPRSRLAQRIDALLDVSVTERFHLKAWQWGIILLALSPLLTIPFHY